MGEAAELGGGGGEGGCWLWGAWRLGGWGDFLDFGDDALGGGVPVGVFGVGGEDGFTGGGVIDAAEEDLVGFAGFDGDHDGEEEGVGGEFGEGVEEAVGEVGIEAGLDGVEAIGAEGEIEFGFGATAERFFFDVDFFDVAGEGGEFDGFVLIFGVIPEIPEAIGVLSIGVDEAWFGWGGEAEGGGGSWGAELIEDGLEEGFGIHGREMCGGGGGWMGWGRGDGRGIRLGV